MLYRMSKDQKEVEFSAEAKAQWKELADAKGNTKWVLFEFLDEKDAFKVLAPPALEDVSHSQQADPLLVPTV